MTYSLKLSVCITKKSHSRQLILYFTHFFLCRDVGIDGDSLMVYALVSMSDGK